MQPSTEALQAWITEAAGLATNPDPVNVLVENQQLFFVIYGICRQSIRYSQAYLATVSSGFEHEAATLARAAFEHAVTAQWCFLIPGANKLLHAGIAASLHDLQTRVAQWLERDDWIEELDSNAPPKNHGRPSFSKMMIAVDPEMSLATIYSLLSQAAHVTAGAVTGFIDSSSEPFTLLEERAGSVVRPYQVLHAAAMASLLALSVLAHVIDDPAMLAVVSQRSDELQLPWLLEGDKPTDS